MAEVEAVARVQRTATDLGRQIGDLRRETSGLLTELGAIDKQSAAALRSMEGLRQKVASRTATQAELASYMDMAKFLERQAPERLKERGAPEMAARLQDLRERIADADRQTAVLRPYQPGWEPLPTGQTPPRGAVTARDKMTGRTFVRTQPELPASGPAPGMGVAAKAERPSVTNADQAAILANRARIYPEIAQAQQLARAYEERVAGGGVLSGVEQTHHRQLSEYLQTASAPMKASEFFSGGAKFPPPPTFEAAQRATAQGSETRATEDQTQALLRANYQKRLTSLNDRQLRQEWTDNTKALGQLRGEIDRVTIAQQRQRSVASQGRLIAPAALPEYEAGLRAASRGLEIQREEMAAHTERRGGRVEGGRMTMPGGASPGRQALGAFVAGAGIGGGSMGGAVLGGVTGALSLPVAAATVAGLLIGKGIQYGARAYEAEMRAMGHALPLARATGVGAETFIDSGIRQARRFRTFEISDLLRATTVLGRSTGRTEIETGVLPVASLTGQTATEEAMNIGALSRFAPGFNPRLPARLLGAYGRSAIARPRIGAGRLRPGQIGPPSPADLALPYETLLYPEFETQTRRLTQATATPFTRVSPEGIGEELSMATKSLRIPGLDMSTLGGLDVAANVVQGANRLVGTPDAGVFGDLQMMAMYKLRNNKAVTTKLQGLGIDINDINGMRRAIARAPQLAAAGVPEVAESIFSNMRDYMPQPFLEMALANKTGDPELGHILATQPEAIIKTWRAGRGGVRAREGRRAEGADIDAAAAAMAGRPDVGRNYEWGIRPEIEQLQTSRELVAQIGDVLTKGMNDLRDTVRQELVTFFNTPGVETQGDRIGALFPGPMTPAGGGVLP